MAFNECDDFEDKVVVVYLSGTGTGQPHRRYLVGVAEPLGQRVRPVCRRDLGASCRQTPFSFCRFDNQVVQCDGGKLPGLLHSASSSFYKSLHDR